MKILEKFRNIVTTNQGPVGSDVISAFTRFGMFYMSIYKDEKQEYLVLMSQNFFELSAPVVYINYASHSCNVEDEQVCFCDNTMQMALIMIRKVGGMILYHSEQKGVIDGFLNEIKAKKLQSKQIVSLKPKHKNIKIQNRAFRSLGFIFNALNLEKIKLIANEVYIDEVIKPLGIEIIQKESMFFYDYTSKVDDE